MIIHKVNKEELFNIVKENIIPVNIIGDIGCGIRPQNFIAPQYHLCIDPHNQYLEFVKNNNKSGVNYSYVNLDWARAVHLFPENSLETVFLLDVIEHLEKDAALMLLSATKKIVTKQIVLFTPLGFIEQNHETDKDAWGLDGGKWQEHKSGWMPEDFGEGWEFFVCEEFHTHDNEGKEYDKPKGAFYAIYNSQKDFYKTEPVFTVAVPTYNQAQYLGYALDSLINQSFPLWEAVVVNDGSTDNTYEVMEKYALCDSRIRIFHKENGGVATALNEGIRNAKGDWICWLSSDDLFEPDKLETHFDAIIKNPEIKFFHSHWYLLLEESQQKIAPPLWLQIPLTEFQVTRFFWANYIHGNAIAVHRTVFDKVGLFDESLRQGQDFDMWLRISSLFESFYIDKRTCITRIHKGQTTNSFAEGGVLDSTRALVQFLNNKPFEALFPFSDLSDPGNILKALNEVIYITTKHDAFLYRCGFTEALAEKTMYWFTTKVPQLIYEKLYPYVKKIVNDYLERPFPAEIKNVLRVFLNKKKIVYKNHNFISDTADYVKGLIEKGDQKQAKAVETYLMKITSLSNFQNPENVLYKPVLLESSENNLHESIDPSKIKCWTVEPGNMISNTVIHSLKLCCNKCNNTFNIRCEYEMSKEPTVQNFICPECKSAYRFDDAEFEQDFVKYHYNKVISTEHPNSESSKIAFFVRDASVIGGGAKILFKYINWLIKLGANVTIYSFAKKPDWVNTKIKYVQIQNELEIKTSYRLLFVFSIFDVPFVLNRIQISKVVHICQGYEGYHFGRDYEENRSDKHILTKLHAIPVKNISVSSHLIQLFESKFGRISEYVPNGIDHRIFKYAEFNEREKSILFIGNPFHPLKGFSFLAMAIKRIQQSPFKVDGLKLNIVMGGNPENKEAIINQLYEELGCLVGIKVKLESSQIAMLMQKASVVVCTSWYEGFSLPLLEGMACGTPVITTYNLGAQSFCEHGVNSLSVNYGDIETLAQYLIDIINQTKDFSKLISNGYKTSLHYSEYNSVIHFIDALENILEKDFDDEKKKLLVGEYNFSEMELPENGFADADNQKYEVSVVIPVYNQLNYTKQCIDSLADTVNQKVELIIVDNASTDGTAEFLSSYKNEKINPVLIRNDENLGFPAAVNKGIELSKGNFIVIANNDIIFSDNWLKRMIEVAESDNKIGLVGPISNEVSGLQRDENANYKTLEEMMLYTESVSKRNKNKVLNFPRLAFLCTLIKREVIEKIGGLDERFSPGNYEDDDYCLRAQLAGYKAVIAKDVFIHHFGSKSFIADGNESYRTRLEINREIFAAKWGGTPEEIWLQNKSVNPRQYFYPINKNPFIKYFERTKVHIEDNELEIAEKSIYQSLNNFDYTNSLITYTDLLNLAGNISLANNNLETAAAYFEKELTEDSNSSSACLGLGQVLMLNDQPVQAKIMFEWAIRYNSNNQHAIKFLAEINAKLGHSVDHISVVE
ncbi:MAG: glycosyltransferase [Bacteroidota bacterium]